MRNRAMDVNGDYQFGRAGLFLVDTPAAVAQAIKTKLLLVAGEWFLDADEGTPYNQHVLGYHTQDTRDLAIKERILSTPGVVEILQYASSVADRRFLVDVTVSTLYGPSASVTLEF